MVETRQRSSPCKTGSLRTLAVDIGGTDIKTIMLDEKGDLLSDRLQVKTDPTVLRMIAGLPLPDG